jgi:hypothetical protein
MKITLELAEPLAGSGCSRHNRVVGYEDEQQVLVHALSICSNAPLVHPPPKVDACYFGAEARSIVLRILSDHASRTSVFMSPHGARRLVSP